MSVLYCKVNRELVEPTDCCKSYCNKTAPLSERHAFCADCTHSAQAIYMNMRRSERKDDEHCLQTLDRLAQEQGIEIYDLETGDETPEFSELRRRFYHGVTLMDETYDSETTVFYI